MKNSLTLKKALRSIITFYLLFNFYHVPILHAQNLRSVMVNACAGTGSEGDNEYLVFYTDSSEVIANSSSIDVRDGSSFPASVQITDTLAPNGNAGFVNGLNAKLNSSCDFTFKNVNWGDTIPAHSYFLLMDSDPTDTARYSAWCGEGYDTIYVVFSVDRSWGGSGLFPNNSSKDAHIQSRINGQVKNYRYSSSWSSNSDGNVALWQDTGAASAYINYPSCVPTNSNALPIELLSFTIKNVDAHFAHLSWSTATEADNAGFTIFHTNDFENYDSSVHITGQGFSSSITRYMHSFPIQQEGETHYFFLEQQDFNGTKTRYGPIKIQSSGNSSCSIYPTLIENTSTKIQIKTTIFEEEVLKADLVSLNGMKLNVSLEKREIELPKDLLPGVYILRIITSLGEYSFRVHLTH